MSVGCAGVEPVAPVNDRSILPPKLKFVAEAVSVDANNRKVECAIETLIQLSERVERSEARVVQFGSGGGDARRYVDKENGNAVLFWADTYFEDLRIHLIGNDSIEIRSPISEGTPERFWREFAVFAGNTRNANPTTGELAQGNWTCQPMDTPPSSGEYYDVDGFAAGTWILRKGTD